MLPAAILPFSMEARGGDPEAQLSAVFDPQTVERGYEYFQEGAVLQFTVGDRGVKAVVRGSARAVYGVYIPFATGSNILDPYAAGCTCPVGTFCKHIVAVILEYDGELALNGEAPEESETTWSSRPSVREVSPHRTARRRTPEQAFSRLSKAVEAWRPRPDTVVPLESDARPGEPSRVRAMLPPRPAGAARPRDRWRAAFIVSDRPQTELRYRQSIEPGMGGHAYIAPAVQFIKKNGDPGRVEKYREELLSEPPDPAAEALLRRLVMDGLEAPLLLHWDHIVAHPGLPIYRAGQGGRGWYQMELLPARITRIGLGFEPLGTGDSGTIDVRLRPILRVRIDGKEKADGLPEISWVDVWRGRCVCLLDQRWLAWCEGSDRLLALVHRLWKYKPLLSRGEIGELRRIVEDENDPLVAFELPYTSLRLVSRRPRVDLLLKESVDGIRASLAFDYRDAGISPPAAQAANEWVLFPPDLELEAKVAEALGELFTGTTAPRYEVQPPRQWRFDIGLGKFLGTFGGELLSRGIGLSLEDVSQRLTRAAGPLAVRVESGIDWFELKATAGEDIDLSGLDVEDPLFSQGFIRNSRGILYIGKEETEKLRKIVALLDPSQRAPRVSRRDLQSVAQLRDLASQEAPEDLRRIADIARALARPNALPAAAPPEGFHGKLRDYQRTGYGWLLYLAREGLHGCLADDMGLGKTIQALAFMQGMRESGSTGASLVVAPVSTLQNWQAEAKRFTPSLRTVVHHGTRRPRSPDGFGNFDLVIVSYATLRVDLGLFQQREWDMLILDEAQSVKNPASQSFDAVKQLKSRHRFTLTGTPLENSVIDLWAQFEFLEPGLLGSLQRFRKEFGSREDRSGPARKRLRRLVQPFILRRTKDVVEKSLPPKEEVCLYAEMGDRQRRAYDTLKDTYRKRIAGSIAERGIAGCGALIFEGLLRLRQAACFPAHASPSLAGLPSAKLELLQDLVAEVVAEKHRILVFSQFVQSLKEIAASLDERKLAYAYLDGATRNRLEVITRFQSDPRIPVFLLSLRAGGLGVNLTAADYVILFDPWWNPAVERQAVDRSHRIGQSKPVFVYRLITRESIEEQILTLQERKRELAADLVEENPRSLLSLSEEELLGLFR